jgi:hypothetical protein
MAMVFQYFTSLDWCERQVVFAAHMRCQVGFEDGVDIFKSIADARLDEDASPMKKRDIHVSQEIAWFNESAAKRGKTVERKETASLASERPTSSSSEYAAICGCLCGCECSCLHLCVCVCACAGVSECESEGDSECVSVCVCGCVCV